MSRHLQLTPHRKQHSIIVSPAKRKVVVTGRRFGKTTMVSMIAALGLAGGKRVLYVAPKESQTEAFWRMVREHFGPEIALGIAHKNETLHLLEMGEGAIRAKTGFDADTLRGDYADVLILDEFAFMDADVWDVVGQPMLLDNDGDAVFITTPSRKNHAYRLFLKADADETGRWQAWHATSHDNPYLSTEALAELVVDMPEGARRQEIMAEFLEGEGQVFRNILANLYTPADLEQHKGHRRVAGLDWGRQNDATVLSVGCADCSKEIGLFRLTRISYPEQRDFIKDKWSGLWEPDLLAESNSIGLPNIEQLRVDGVRCSGFDTTLESKGKIIVNLQLALEKQTWQWIDNKVATAELEAYEMKTTRIGNATYAAPEGLHDDTVMARAIMLWRATHAGGHTVA